MNRWIVLAACMCVGACGDSALSASWDRVILRDDFATPSEGPPDPAVWIINHPGHWWWVQGRTHFPDPLSTAGPFPRVQHGVCIIEHHLYNPYDLGAVKTTFMGGEIRTVMEFTPDRAYRFEARVRCYSDPPRIPYPSGLVTSFFTYGYDGARSDEIDFEFLSRKMNDNAAYPNGDPVLTNPWDESGQCPQYVAPTGLDLTAWNTFRIYWLPALRRVEWTWLDPSRGETLLRAATAGECVPDEAMALYFNFWAPGPDWPDAFSADLQPAGSPDQNRICGYEIDYAEVRIPGRPDFNADGDVDLDDFTEFQACFNGPNRPPAGAGCAGADFDADNDVDLADFLAFQGCFNGPNRPAACR